MDPPEKDEENKNSLYDSILDSDGEDDTCLDTSDLHSTIVEDATVKTYSIIKIIYMPITDETELDDWSFIEHCTSLLSLATQSGKVVVFFHIVAKEEQKQKLTNMITDLKDKTGASFDVQEAASLLVIMKEYPPIEKGDVPKGYDLVICGESSEKETDVMIEKKGTGKKIRMIFMSSQNRKMLNLDKGLVFILNGTDAREHSFYEKEVFPLTRESRSEYLSAGVRAFLGEELKMKTVSMRFAEENPKDCVEDEAMRCTTSVGLLRSVEGCKTWLKGDLKKFYTDMGNVVPSTIIPTGCFLTAKNTMLFPRNLERDPKVTIRYEMRALVGTNSYTSNKDYSVYLVSAYDRSKAERDEGEIVWFDNLDPVLIPSFVGNVKLFYHSYIADLDERWESRTNKRSYAKSQEEKRRRRDTDASTMWLDVMKENTVREEEDTEEEDGEEEQEEEDERGDDELIIAWRSEGLRNLSNILLYQILTTRDDSAFVSKKTARLLLSQDKTCSDLWKATAQVKSRIYTSDDTEGTIHEKDPAVIAAKWFLYLSKMKGRECLLQFRSAQFKERLNLLRAAWLFYNTALWLLDPAKAEKLKLLKTDHRDPGTYPLAEKKDFDTPTILWREDSAAAYFCKTPLYIMISRCRKNRKQNNSKELFSFSYKTINGNTMYLWKSAYQSYRQPSVKQLNMRKTRIILRFKNDDKKRQSRIVPPPTKEQADAYAHLQHFFLETVRSWNESREQTTANNGIKVLDCESCVKLTMSDLIFYDAMKDASTVMTYKKHLLQELGDETRRGFTFEVPTGGEKKIPQPWMDLLEKNGKKMMEIIGEDSLHKETLFSAFASTCWLVHMGLFGSIVKNTASWGPNDGFPFDEQVLDGAVNALFKLNRDQCEELEVWLMKEVDIDCHPVTVLFISYLRFWTHFSKQLRFTEKSSIVVTKERMMKLLFKDVQESMQKRMLCQYVKNSLIVDLMIPRHGGNAGGLYPSIYGYWMGQEKCWRGAMQEVLQISQVLRTDGVTKNLATEGGGKKLQEYMEVLDKNREERKGAIKTTSDTFVSNWESLSDLFASQDEGVKGLKKRYDSFANAVNQGEAFYNNYVAKQVSSRLSRETLKTVEFRFQEKEIRFFSDLIAQTRENVCSAYNSEETTLQNFINEELKKFFTDQFTDENGFIAKAAFMSQKHGTEDSLCYKWQQASLTIVDQFEKAWNAMEKYSPLGITGIPDFDCSQEICWKDVKKAYNEVARMLARSQDDTLFKTLAKIDVTVVNIPSVMKRTVIHPLTRIFRNFANVALQWFEKIMLPSTDPFALGLDVHVAFHEEDNFLAVCQLLPTIREKYLEAIRRTYCSCAATVKCFLTRYLLLACDDSFCQDGLDEKKLSTYWRTFAVRENALQMKRKIAQREIVSRVCVPVREDLMLSYNLVLSMYFMSCDTVFVDTLDGRKPMQYLLAMTLDLLARISVHATANKDMDLATRRWMQENPMTIEKPDFWILLIRDVCHKTHENKTFPLMNLYLYILETRLLCLLRRQKPKQSATLCLIRTWRSQLEDPGKDVHNKTLKEITSYILTKEENKTGGDAAIPYAFENKDVPRDMVCSLEVIDSLLKVMHKTELPEMTTPDLKEGDRWFIQRIFDQSMGEVAERTPIVPSMLLPPQDTESTPAFDPDAQQTLACTEEMEFEEEDEDERKKLKPNQELKILRVDGECLMQHVVNPDNDILLEKYRTHITKIQSWFLSTEQDSAKITEYRDAANSLPKLKPIPRIITAEEFVIQFNQLFGQNFIEFLWNKRANEDKPIALAFSDWSKRIMEWDFWTHFFNFGSVLASALIVNIKTRVLAVLHGWNENQQYPPLLTSQARLMNAAREWFVRTLFDENGPGTLWVAASQIPKEEGWIVFEHIAKWTVERLITKDQVFCFITKPDQKTFAHMTYNNEFGYRLLTIAKRTLAASLEHSSNFAIKTYVCPRENAEKTKEDNQDGDESFLSGDAPVDSFAAQTYLMLSQLLSGVTELFYKTPNVEEENSPLISCLSGREADGEKVLEELEKYWTRMGNLICGNNDEMICWNKHFKDKLFVPIASSPAFPSKHTVAAILTIMFRAGNVLRTHPLNEVEKGKNIVEPKWTKMREDYVWYGIVDVNKRTMERDTQIILKHSKFDENEWTSNNLVCDRFFTKDDFRTLIKTVLGVECETDIYILKAVTIANKLYAKRKETRVVPQSCLKIKKEPKEEKCATTKRKRKKGTQGLSAAEQRVMDYVPQIKKK